jgi:hypothetical protein
MKKKSGRTKASTKNKLIFTTAFVLVTVTVITGAYVTYAKVSRYDDAANQAEMVSVRELILLAVKELKKDAPVEPRTGNIYFPESKLYLPNPGTALSLTYVFDTSHADAQSELSVSTNPVRGTQALYSARNMEELFAAVPKLQACSRGIKLVHNKFDPNYGQNVLKHTVKLNNGLDLYVYLEKDCPELGETADLFKNIRAY